MMTSTTWTLMMASVPANVSLISLSAYAKYLMQHVQQDLTETNSQKPIKFFTRRTLCAT